MPTAGHFYCDVCMMPFEDNYKLQRHLGTNKHVNTLIKKRGGNIDEIDIDEVVDIAKLTKQELRDYVKNTDRYKELCGELVDKWNGMWNRIREIDRMIGRECVDEREGDNSGDEADDYESRVKANMFIDPTIESRVPVRIEMSCEKRCSLIEEKDMLICQSDELTKGSKGDQITKSTTYAFETIVKELRTEYVVFEKAKEKRLEKAKKEAEKQAEKDRKEAERQQEKDRKDEARRKKEEMSRMILQARMGLLNPTV